MINKPLVSIIIPVYNREDLIGFTLNSIKKQTYQNWECLIIDDGSNDNTKDVVNQFVEVDDRFQYYLRTDKYLSGGNGARNYGYDLSKGELINWFDSDDLMKEDKLERQVQRLNKSDSPFTVCQTLVFQGAIDNIIGDRFYIHSDDFFNDFVCNKIKWLTQAPMLRKSFLEDNMLRFDEQLTQSQERDFFIRVLSCVDDYDYDLTPLVYFRVHDKSISFAKHSENKVKSNFLVDYNVLRNLDYKLSNTSKAFLRKNLKNNLQKSLNNNFKNLSSFFLKKLFSPEVSLSYFEKLKLYIGFISFKVFKRGYVFFK